MIEACLRCGSTDHLIRDCPRRTATSTSVSTVRPTPLAPRGRKSGKAEAVSTSQRPISKFVERAEGRMPARAYAIRAQEEQDAPDVIKGMFLLYNTSVHALVNPGSTHSYICIKLPVEKGIPVEKSDQDILVTNSLGHSVVVNKIHKGYPLKI